MCTLYVDMLSQPSRACALMCRSAGLPIEEVIVRIDKKQHQSPDYTRTNPFGKVPCLQDGQFSLPESGAILRYLCSKYAVEDHWYPKEIQSRARVDCAMDWCYTSLRPGAAQLCWHEVIANRRGLPSSIEQASIALNALNKALLQLDEIWLQKNLYMAGMQISIADLLVLSELDQLRLLHGRYDFWGKHPNIASYLSRLNQELAPHHDIVCKALDDTTRATIGKL